MSSDYSLRSSGPPPPPQEPLKHGKKRGSDAEEPELKRQTRSAAKEALSKAASSEAPPPPRRRTVKAVTAEKALGKRKQETVELKSPPQKEQASLFPDNLCDLPPERWDELLLAVSENKIEQATIEKWIKNLSEEDLTNLSNLDNFKKLLNKVIENFDKAYKTQSYLPSFINQFLYGETLKSHCETVLGKINTVQKNGILLLEELIRPLWAVREKEVMRLFHAGANLKSGANLNKGGFNGSTPLFMAVELKLPNVVSKLIDAGANLNTKGGFNGCTPLSMAVELGLPNIVSKLIDAGANFNTPNKTGTTPLHIAVAQGHTEIVQKLIEVNADLNAAQQGGSTPLYSAMLYGRTAIALQLIEAKADLNAPLHFAILYGNTKIALKLIEAKPDFNAVDKDGRTVLHSAIAHGRIEIALKLIEAHADLDAVDKKSRRSIQLAILSRNIEVVFKALIKAKVSIDDELLKQIIAFGNREIITTLINNGLEITKEIRDELSKHNTQPSSRSFTRPSAVIEATQVSAIPADIDPTTALAVLKNHLNHVLTTWPKEPKQIEGQAYKKETLQDGIEKLLNNVKDRVPTVAAPPSDEKVAFEAYYRNIEEKLYYITSQLKGKIEDHETTLESLAICGINCGTRQFQEVDNAVKYYQSLEGKKQQEAIPSQTKHLDEVLYALRSSIYHPILSQETDVHDINLIKRALGEPKGVEPPGSSYADPLHEHEVAETASRLGDQFDRKYNEQAMIAAIRTALTTNKELKNELSKLLANFKPSKIPGYEDVDEGLSILACPESMGYDFSDEWLRYILLRLGYLSADQPLLQTVDPLWLAAMQTHLDDKQKVENDILNTLQTIYSRIPQQVSLDGKSSVEKIAALQAYLTSLKPMYETTADEVLKRNIEALTDAVAKFEELNRRNTYYTAETLKPLWEKAEAIRPMET